ncbi:N-acetylmuramoyl-L-alanine amidase [Propylenella binzhouense]|uniref:N-acetylmuramoyl-L-alanine amidase n=1 Tax=Propylenella binzhouense TaxID=2555902 RepID=A0A964T2S3_9HYPH|nr:N-acetylmuramoyl-L-alanine amidase [Propylenella binzhouense]MYZ47185.1 N-acetylmuramoyl-L-alanine amidase [Propylenella binzhouense]
MIRLVLSILFAAASLVAQASAATVSDLRLIGDAGRTRLVVDVSNEPEFALLRLTDPYRLIVDLPDVEFAVASGAGEGRGLVADFRYGLIEAGKGRIVLDLTGPVSVARSFVLPPAGPQPARLVVDLVPAEAGAYAEAAEADKEKVAEAEPSEAVVTEQAAPRSRPVVVIDPGHGGIDSGATGDKGLLEKDVTLAFARAVADKLREGGHVQAFMTRDKDEFLSLNERVEVARAHHASLFVSIHADTVRQDYVRGATVYTVSEEASDALAAAVAERENKSDILAGLSIEDQPDEVATILFDLARRETKNVSVRFARVLVDDLRSDVPLNKSPWRRAAFRVLRAPDVPSVLLELGYLSNQDDEALLTSPEWREKTAERVARAIERFMTGSIASGQ